MGTIISVKNLVHRYGTEEGRKETKALDGVSFDIREGSKVAIIGRNGSGKSTLAKHLNALLIPAEGKVQVAGMDTADPENTFEIRQTVAMVFQNPDNQIVSSIVEDDIAFGPENIGIEPHRIRQLVDEALDAVGMKKYANKGPHMLSGGQKQRIAIAGAIAMRPRCIVFDEPTAMLDPKGRKDVLEIIEKLNREGITTVLVTHFMEEAAAADKVLVMSEGRLAMEGTPGEVFSRGDELRELGLEVPFAVDMAERIARQFGADVPGRRESRLGANITTETELVKAICQLK